MSPDLSRPARRLQLGLLGLLLLLPALAQGAGRVPVALFTLPGQDTDLTTAREVRLQLLELFGSDRSARLFDAIKSTQKTNTPPPPYKPLLNGGMKALADGRYSEAIEKLERAVTMIEPALAQVSKTVLSDAVVHLAAAQLGAGQRRDALATLHYLLTWRAQHSLLLRVPPPAGWRKLTDQARAWLAQAPTSSIRIVSQPPQAEAFVDGRRLGQTPVLASNLTVGTHYISLHLEGYTRLVVPVRVTRRQQTAQITMHRDAEASTLTTLTRRLQPALGRSMIPALKEVRSLVDAQQALLVVVSATPSTLQIHGYLYDLNRCHLIRTAEVSTSRPAVPRHLLALRLWQLTPTAPPTATQPPGPAATPVMPPVFPGATSQPAPAGPGRSWYRQWWVWAAAGTIGALGLSLGIALPLTLGNDEGSGREHLQLRW